MKISEVLKKAIKPDPKPSAMDDTLDAIIAIEKRDAATKGEFEAAQKKLQTAEAAAIDGDESGIADAVAAVAAVRDRGDAIKGLMQDARNKAIATIAATAAWRRKRLAEVEKEIITVRAGIDTRLVKAISEFCRKHDLKVQWSTKHVAGTIVIPSMSIDRDECEQVAGSVVAAIPRDQDADWLASLLAERQRINILISSQPDIALDGLLAERRRQ